MLKFAYTILYVQDVPTSIGFYRKALGFEQKMLTPEEDYAELISGDCTLAFAQHDLAKSNITVGYKEVSKQGKPFGIELGFVCENPEEIMKIAADFGAEILEPIKVKPWGQKVGYLRDLDGFLLEIATPMK